MATSREPLRAPGEYVYRVLSLELPAEGAQDREDLLEAAAVKLFVARARAVDLRFSPDARSAAITGAICRRLDGIPLAIELAAARTATLGLEELAVRLDDRFRLLTAGHRTALPRHQTLRATLDWSYELPSERERVVLQRLAVFAGSFGLDAASEIAASVTDVANAEECFRQALEWGRRQDALSWELRSATSLAHLYHRQGRTTQARKVLTPVYRRFTEGFETADLLAAKALLDALR